MEPRNREEETARTGQAQAKASPKAAAGEQVVSNLAELPALPGMLPLIRPGSPRSGSHLDLCEPLED
jgi:hypothetical protein